MHANHDQLGQSRTARIHAAIPAAARAIDKLDGLCVHEIDRHTVRVARFGRSGSGAHRRRVRRRVLRHLERVRHLAAHERTVGREEKSRARCVENVHRPLQHDLLTPVSFQAEPRPTQAIADALDAAPLLLLCPQALGDARVRRVRLVACGLLITLRCQAFEGIPVDVTVKQEATARRQDVERRRRRRGVGDRPEAEESGDEGATTEREHSGLKLRCDRIHSHTPSV